MTGPERCSISKAAQSYGFQFLAPLLLGHVTLTILVSLSLSFSPLMCVCVCLYTNKERANTGSLKSRQLKLYQVSISFTFCFHTVDYFREWQKLIQGQQYLSHPCYLQIVNIPIILTNCKAPNPSYLFPKTCLSSS